MIAFILAAIVFFILSIWILCFLYLNDFSIPQADISNFAKVLLIYPHPDDEVLTAGGLIGSLPVTCKSTLLLLTKGEKGTPDGVLDPALKGIRAKEAKEAQRAMGLTNLIHLDYGDGEMKNRKKDIALVIEKTIQEEDPDLIITYDLSGLYGHDDHITVAEVVTSLVLNKFKNIKLWYASFPQRVLKMTKLPVHMAKDKKFISRRVTPTHKVFIGLNVINKISAVYAHKSQLPSYRKGIPYRIPMRFYYSMTLFEYFHQAN